jgi:hypothetical protein
VFEAERAAVDEAALVKGCAEAICTDRYSIIILDNIPILC